MASPFPSSLSGQVAGPDWESRIGEGAYNAPSGNRFVFEWEDLSREYDKRTAIFEFPRVDGAYIQDNGVGPRQYPLRCIFSGPNCDRYATAFEAALIERGPGKLEHPFYGPVDVVPCGRIARRDDLATAANQSIVEVTFFSTLGTVYPSRAGDPKNEINAALERFNLAAAGQFADTADLTSTVAKANLKDTIRKQLKQVSAALASVANATAEVKAEFDDYMSVLNYSLDVLIGQPLLLAQQMINLVTAPARAALGILSRLEAYQRFAQSLVDSVAGSSSSDSTTVPGIYRKVKNDFLSTDVFALASVAGTVTSVLETQFTTRVEAMQAAAAVMAQMDELVAWREERFGGLNVIDTGEAYQALQEAVALVAGYLIEVSFTLLPERVKVLDRQRTIIDLCAELYGSVDDKLDFFITTNDLSGSEILELPAGAIVRYYEDAA